jgi:putative peptide zinc metalloprotease protein
MNAPLRSDAWYRVADLRPRLADRARVHRQRYRGETWYLLQDLGSSRVHRFAPNALPVLAAMDGSRTVQVLWEMARERLADAAPTQDELIRWLGQLHAADLLLTDVPPDVLEVFERHRQTTAQRQRRSWANPMAIRIPLWDPGRFLDRINPWTRWFWSRWGLLGWLIVVVPALVLALEHMTELTHNFTDRVLQVDNLLLLLVVFPIIKVLHELGHATAARAGGAQVHDLGVMLLVLMPVPYVDASGASVFRSKGRRAVVGVAGMAVETFLAALALYAWLAVEPGAVRSTLFDIMLVAGVSTLLFNGNPLLRYDAYYILCDLIEMPNLARRSLAYWGYLIERHVLRAADAKRPAASGGERAWFVVYGIASTLYRAFITFSIALFIGSRFFFVGVLLAAWGLAMMLLVPLGRGAAYLLNSPQLGRHRARAAWIVAGALLGVLGFAAFVPVPSRSVCEGVIWLPESSIVRAGANGFFDGFLTPPGSQVSPGQVLTLSHDPALDASIRLSEARVAELEATFAVQYVEDRAQAEIVREQLQAERAVLERARERANSLRVPSAAVGQFSVEQPQDMPGRFHKQGEVLGYVLGEGPRVARVVVRQSDIDEAGFAPTAVEVLLSHAIDRVVAGRIVRQVPAGASSLPSRALASHGGGQVAVDPRDPQGLRTLERMFQIDVELTEPQGPTAYGERVHVRFVHPPTPLAVQGYRALRRLFLSHFDV